LHSFQTFLLGNKQHLKVDDLKRAQNSIPKTEFAQNEMVYKKNQQQHRSLKNLSAECKKLDN